MLEVARGLRNIFHTHDSSGVASTLFFRLLVITLRDFCCRNSSRSM